MSICNIMSVIKDCFVSWSGRFARWCKRHVSETAMMFIVVTVIGLISGIGAFLLKSMIAYVARLLTDNLNSLGANRVLIFIPLSGLVLTGLMTRYLFRTKIDHGVRWLKEKIKIGDYYIAPSRMIYPILASTVTLGFGGSAGSEGPIACTGAAVGGNFARWLSMSPQMVLLMIGCGAGAGIAGIFKSPLGGALFTLEVMRIPMMTVSVLALLVCTVVSAMTAYALDGFTLDLSMEESSMMFDVSVLPFVIALGLLCGLYSLYYSFIMKHVELRLMRIPNSLVRSVVGGTFLGVAVFVFPSLYGEGYGVIGNILNGSYGAVISGGAFVHCGGGTGSFILIALGTVGVKCFATSATNSGGGVAGDFAPTLFAGCMLGCLFATSLNYLFDIGLSVEMFALFGMAGVMAGAIRAPLMALMLTTEMVGVYGSFFPLLVTASISFGVVRLFTADDFFTRHPDKPNGLLSAQ